MKALKVKRSAKPEGDYEGFAQLDGRHPWQTQVPEGRILYPARRLAGGKVSYFNFELAKEMGLINGSHPNRLNRALQEKILDTFCLRIVNEYDQQHRLRFDRTQLKPNLYMATRYLQLQHTDKTGRTSGDGRCIWNGQFRGHKRTWDVSSRGTGVTALAPGSVEAGRPLQSGNEDHGYGCGMAEIDELFAAAILAEIFHRNGISTERVLAIIDLGKGVGIGVRAAPNLIRPAHMFLYLKQGRIEALRRSVDYFIERQFQNGSWAIRPGSPDRYSRLLSEVSGSFARFAAQLDRDYIFAWLDWDGDNVLADAGIIDYGSVRQFGLRHDQYRYDDVQRFSTNLNEQFQKARDIVQTFAQLVDFLQTGTKRSWRDFAQSPSLRDFNEQFRRHCLDRLLFQMGFTEPLRRVLLNRHRREVEHFYRLHSELERTKTHRKLRKVADGIHRPAIFNMRRALAHMADYVNGLPFEFVPLVEPQEFYSWMISTQANLKDRRPTPNRDRLVMNWQKSYLRLLRSVAPPPTWDKTVDRLCARALKINHEGRMTGNALIHIVDEILRFRRRGLSDNEIQTAIEDLIAAQTLNPDFEPHREATTKPPRALSLIQNFLTVVHGFREDI